MAFGAGSGAAGGAGGAGGAFAAFSFGGFDSLVTTVADAFTGSPTLASRDVREQEKAKFSRSVAQAAAIASSELAWRSELLHARSSLPLAFSRLHTSARNWPSPTS